MVFDAPSRWIRACAIQAVLMIAITAVATRTTTADPASLEGAARAFDRYGRSRVDGRSRQSVADVPTLDRDDRGNRRDRLCRAGPLRTWRPGVPDDVGDPRGELSDPSNSDRPAPETAGTHGVDRSRAPARDRGAGEPRAGGYARPSTCSTHREAARTANRSKPVPRSRPGSPCGMRSSRPSTRRVEPGPCRSGPAGGCEPLPAISGSSSRRPT